MSSKHIAAAVASVAVVAAFGAGAFALAQSSGSFDPQDFTSAYSKGAEAANRGYQANPIDTDAAANRNKDDLDSNDKTAEAEHPNKDVFSDYPLQGASGTTAYNVTGQAELGGVGIANGEGGESGTGAGSGNAGGAVVVKPDGNSGNAGNGNAGGAGSGDAPGKADDNPGGGDPTPSPSDPGYDSDKSYDVLPTDPGYEEKDTEKNSGDIFYKPVNSGNSSMKDVKPDDAHAVIMASGDSDHVLYTGQRLDAWTVFCSLSTFYVYNREAYSWTCSKDEFATYPYFRVVDFPKVVPNKTFPVTVSYRFNDADTWHTETIEYEPAESCTFILTGKVDDKGSPVVLKQVRDGFINLLRYTEDELSAMGYLDYGQVSHMILGWKEGDHEVGPFYTAEPGRHVIEPTGFAEVPANYTVDTSFYYLTDDMQVDLSKGTYLSYLQRLYAIQDSSLGGTLVSNAFTLNVPLGVQAIEINEWLGPVNVGRLVLPSSTYDVVLSFMGLVVWDSFAVDADNPTYAATADGILTSKDGKEYLGVPMSREKLEVPADVTEVLLQSGNNLHQLVLHADDEGGLPYVSLETLNYCNILVDDDLLPDLVSNNTAALTQGNGNTISVASDPSVQYRTEHGMVFNDDELKYVANTGADMVSVDGPHTIAKGCFEGNTDTATIVLGDDGDYSFEAGSLSDGSVDTVVCRTEAQRASVQKQMGAAGGNDVAVVVSGESTEGYRYFTADKDGGAFTTLLKAPDGVTRFEGSFTAVDGTAICPDAVSARAFADNADLQWVILDSDTSTVGANAFAGCSNLQGVFIGSPDTATVGADAFDGCTSLRFIASRAMYGNFDFTTSPSAGCQLFRPTGSDGSDGYIYNFQYFTPESGVTDYKLVQLGDGGFVLYGCDDNGPWLAISSGSTITGEVTLPQTTTEFYINSFKNVQGGFTVNWRDLQGLQYVDGSAFMNSTLTGEVYIGSNLVDHVSIASDAFSSCPNITSLCSDAPMFDCASWAFSNCENLKSAKLAVSYSYDQGFVLQSNIFYGCPSLETIEIDSWNPSSLLLQGKGYPFRFDGDSDNVDDSERIRLIVPEGSEEYYLKEWLYCWLGYASYDEYYTNMYQQLYTQTGIEPSRTQVKEAMSEGMLTAENQLRKMMGMDLVDHSSFITIDEQDGYAFQTSEGTTTLISAPADAKVIDLDDVIGSKYDSVVLGDGAFAGCDDLEQVIVGSKVSAIEPNAFTGCDGVTVTMPEECTTMLMGSSRTNPFRFGADIKLDIPEASQTDYLATWPMQCVGILDDFALGDYFFDVWVELWDLYPDEGPSGEQLNLAVNTPFLEQENYLRGLMGLEPLTDITELEGYIDASGMVGLRADAQREPVAAAIATLSAHNGSVTKALQAAGLIASRAGDGKAVDNGSESSPQTVASIVAETKDAIEEEPAAKVASGSDEEGPASRDEREGDGSGDGDGNVVNATASMTAAADEHSPATLQQRPQEAM